MKNRGLGAVALAVAAASALILSGCSSSGASGSSGGKDFEFWSFTGINQKADVKVYEKLDTGANIKLTEVGSSTDTAQALTAALASGKVPDLVLIQGDDIPKFLENPGNFVDLRTLGADKIKKDYLPWTYAAGAATNGAQLGIPTDVGGMSMAYRTDLFQKAGLPTDPDAVAKLWPTWKDFISVGKDFTQKTGTPFVDNVSTSVFYDTVNQVSEKYYTPKGKPVYDTNPQVRKAFDTAVDAYKAGISAKLATFSSGWSAGKGKDAFAVMTAPSWLLSSIKSDAPNTAGKWAVTTVPGVAGNWGGSFLAIPKKAKHPEAAWNYIKTMMSPKQQLAHFKTAGTLPTTIQPYTSDAVQSYTEPFFGDSPIGKVLAESVQKFKPFYNGPDTNAIGSGLINALIDMEAGNTAPDQAWSVGLKNVKQALAK